MMGLREELSAVAASGRLWDNPWWLKPEWRKFFSISDEEYESSFQLLQETFDEEWVKGLDGDIGYHPLIQALFFRRGVRNIQTLINLADNLKQLEGVQGFHRVLADYNTLYQARNAGLEMFMGGAFARAGCDVEYIVPKSRKGPTPDLLVRKGEAEFTVECKFMSDASREKWIENYRTWYGRRISASVPTEYSVWFQPFVEHLDPSCYGPHDGLTPPELAAELDTLQVRTAIEEMLYSFRLPQYRWIEGKGTLAVFPEGYDYMGQIGLPGLSRRFFFNRLVSNGIKTASKQIQAYRRPGIASVLYSGVSDLGWIKPTVQQVFLEKPEGFECVMGVLLFPMQNVLKYMRPYWIENESSAFSAAEMGVTDMLYELFRPIT